MSALIGLRGRREAGRAVATGFLALVMLFLFLPVLLIVLFSVSASPTLTFPIPGLTTRWFSQAQSDPQFVQALSNSLILAGVTAVGAGVLGAAAAFGVQRFRPQTRERLTYVALLPSIMPGLVIGIALAVALNAVGVHLSLKTAAFGHMLIAFPFVFLTIRARLDAFDFSVIEAARDLGASRRRAFYDITLPLIRAAILGAALISMSMSLDEFVITSFTIGADQTLPVLIWARMRIGVSPEVNALGTLILGGTLAAGMLSYRFARVRI